MQKYFIGCLLLAAALHGQYTPPGGGGTGGAVSSVYGRTGAVVATPGDYTAAQVTNAVDTTSTYSNPGWLTALANTKVTGLTAFATLATGASTTYVRGDATTQTHSVASLTDGPHIIVDTGSYSNPGWITAIANAKVTGLTAFATLASGASSTYVRGDASTQTHNCASLTDATAACSTPVGTGASNLVQLTAASKLPAVDGSLLTNLPSGGTTWNAPASITSVPSCTSSIFFQPFNDSAWISHAYCNGSSTLSYYLSGGLAVTPIGTTSATYAWTNQCTGCAVTKQTNGVWSFDFPSHGVTSNSVSVYDAAIPSAPSSQTFRIVPGATNAMLGGGDEGIVLRESGTGKLLTISYSFFGSSTCGGTNVPCIVVSKWASTSSYTGQVANSIQVNQFRPITVKVDVASGASGNVTVSWSPDGGLTYSQLYQAAKNAIFTTAPDKIGVYGNNNTSGNADIFLAWLSLD